MTLLAVPLTQAQIDAANRLYCHLRYWRMTDDALGALARAFPTWEPKATLLKVAAVNQLYGTHLYAVDRMAKHVSDLMKAVKPAAASPALVERIANLPETPGQKKQPRHFSFASKLAHFFIGAERYPIYDSYTVRMVGYHLGRKEHERSMKHPYLAHVRNLERLREQAWLTCDWDELDHYLWLAGQYQRYQKWAQTPKRTSTPPPINREVAALFSDPSRQVQADLATLIGSL